MIRPGDPERLGSHPDDASTGFALYSAVAESVELCLFDTDGNETDRHRLPAQDDGVWHGYLPGCRAGQLYGFRVHGPFDPAEGLRCNPAKLLLDPYALELRGDVRWHPSILDHRSENEATIIDTSDSAAFVPKCVVRRRGDDPLPAGPRIPWADALFYECNVRGFTMRHPAVTGDARGTFAGLANGDVVAHLRSLGVTSVELMPVQAFVDERHLVERGLRNFWGYNTIGFFAPMPRYANADAVREFRDMVRVLHDAGLEVILDVVYNHTAEGDETGPTLSFRGIDNHTYYRMDPLDHSSCINDTGCGNTINADHPRVRRLIVDSLAYWANDMGVDGFRFDLATVLGRWADGFAPAHPLLAEISNDPRLVHCKLVAEPWDPGPGGYQLGAFPPRWAEWNDRYRDAVRRFWHGAPGASGELARRLHGSADIFEHTSRTPASSINFVTSHDGFTLADVVSYEHRHNESNGEQNQDGHTHNYSCNHGAEGETADEAVNELRRRQRLNLLATLFFSQGTPMLLAGDEVGNSQSGNNNAYAQDNETGWVDWSGLSRDPDFARAVRELARLRHENPLLRLDAYVHGELRRENDVVRVEWINRAGEHKQSQEWSDNRAFSVVISAVAPDGGKRAVAIVINGEPEATTLTLPRADDESHWRIAFASCRDSVDVRDGQAVGLPALAIALAIGESGSTQG